MNSASSEKLELKASPGLGAWLRGRSISLLVSAYQSGRLISIGADAAGKLHLGSIGFDRSMGLATDSSGVWVATLNTIWHFGYLTGEGLTGRRHDAALVPQAAFVTGYVNAHDLALGPRNQPVFAASMFNCVATTTIGASLVPLWYPKFITDKSPRDACHLNGVALENAKLRFVTVFTQSQEPGAWREKTGDGAVIDVTSNTPLITGLAQPHSPRLHGGRLWFHESGKGAFGYADGNRFVEVLRCPGYLRGLAFDKEIACIGLSKPRHAATAGEAVCGIVFFDVKRGKVVHNLRFGDGIEEIYDVAVLGFSDPLLIAPNSPEASKTYIVGKPTPHRPAGAARGKT